MNIDELRDTVAREIERVKDYERGDRKSSLLYLQTPKEFWSGCRAELEWVLACLDDDDDDDDDMLAANTQFVPGNIVYYKSDPRRRAVVKEVYPESQTMKVYSRPQYVEVVPCCEMAKVA